MCFCPLCICIAVFKSHTVHYFVAAFAKQLTDQTVVQQFTAGLMKPHTISGCTTRQLLCYYRIAQDTAKSIGPRSMQQAGGVSATASSQCSCSAYCFVLCGPRQRETQTCPCVRAKFREDSVEDRTPSPTPFTHTHTPGIPTLRS